MQDNQRKLRGYFHSLQDLLSVFGEAATKDKNIDSSPVQVLFSEITRIESEFPGLLPPIKDYDLGAYSSAGGGTYYKISAIRSYLMLAIGRLRVEIDDTEGFPVTEKRDFTFVHEVDLRKVIERDYLEIQRAFISKCWKSVIILSGGAIEAILMDLLLENEIAAKSTPKAPNKPDIKTWSLANLIDVTVELELVGSGVEKLSHPVREYRNLVHPGNEIRTGLEFDEEEARIALEVLHIVHRDLSS